jgi:hypothetical protein
MQVQTKMLLSGVPSQVLISCPELSGRGLLKIDYGVLRTFVAPLGRLKSSLAGCATSNVHFQAQAEMSRSPEFMAFNF